MGVNKLISDEWHIIISYQQLYNKGLDRNTWHFIKQVLTKQIALL